MRNLKRLSVVAAAGLALVGCGQAAQDTSADEAVIRLSAPAWADACNAGDADAMASMYWDDAVLQPPGSLSAEGASAIREFLADECGGLNDAGLTMNITEAGVVDVSGDLAYEAGTYSVTDISGVTVDTGKYLGVLLKRGGEWRYIRDTWNSDVPAVAKEEGELIEE